jgi:hypothetical protein
MAPRAWTQADDDKLRRLVLAGETSRAIGSQIERAEKAVRARAARLKVLLKRPKFIKRGTLMAQPAGCRNSEGK